MAGIELSDLQPAAIAREVVAQIAIERSGIETMALHDGHGVGIDRHARDLGGVRGAAQTIGPAERNPVSHPEPGACPGVVMRWGSEVTG